MAEDVFKMQRFSLLNGPSGQKVGTDGLLLGLLAQIPSSIPESGINVLDIGTGTGIVALLLAQRLEGESYAVKALEIEASAAQRAARNFASSPWGDFLECLPMGLSAYSAGCVERFDLIVSNPPYYDGSLPCGTSRRDIARNTSRGQEEGLSYREVLSFAAAHLTDGGSVALILPADRRGEMCRCAASHGLFPLSVTSVRTTAAKAPSRIVAQFARRDPAPAIEERTLTLMRADGSYDNEYKDLTKDFLTIWK